MVYDKLPMGYKIRERYLIQRLIGQGAFGMVYLADDLKISGANWAVKEIWEGNIHGAERDEAIDLFRKEAQILSSLNHTGVPKMIDFFSEGNRHYMVMEFVEGKTLEQINEGHGADTKTVIAWALKICDILEYLHDHRPYPIIFRDLKPSNILVTPRGRILLVDFGIARFFNPVKSKDTCELGTPGFCAPEQYGKHQSDVRSDIYALGATVYFLLCGVDLAQFAFKIPPVSRFNGKVEGPVVQILARCLEFEPSMRFQDIHELRQALQDSDGRTPSWPPRFTPPTVQPAPAGALPSAASQASPKKASPFHWSYKIPIVPFMWVVFIASINIANESGAFVSYGASIITLVMILLFSSLLLPGYTRNRQYGSAAFSGLSVLAALLILIAPAVLIYSGIIHDETGSTIMVGSPIPTPHAANTHPPLTGSRISALSACRSNLRNLATTLEMYPADNTKSPPSLSYLTPNYLRSIPTCPAAEVNSYEYIPQSFPTGPPGLVPGSKPGISDPGTSGDRYILFCKGHAHEKDGIKPNFPQYFSVEGLREK